MGNWRRGEPNAGSSLGRLAPGMVGDVGVREVGAQGSVGCPLFFLLLQCLPILRKAASQPKR